MIEVPPDAPEAPSHSAQAHHGASAEREANEESIDSAVSRGRWRRVEIARDWRQRNTIQDKQGFWPNHFFDSPNFISNRPDWAPIRWIV
jgi:hypothetical protein